MATERDLWLTAHFLATAEGGAGRGLNVLAAKAREEVLTAGDRLAQTSIAVAQEYCRNAPVARRVLGPAGFVRWLALGEDLATREPTCCDGALAYFALPPALWAQAGLDAATDWCALGRKLLGSSRRLAVVFFGSTASLVAHRGGIERLRHWVSVTLELHQRGGWTGEFLAQTFLSAAPTTLFLLRPEAYRLWAAVGAALYPVVKEAPALGRLADVLADWSEEEREVFLCITLTIAGVSAKDAYVFFAGLPPSVRGLAAWERKALLGALQRAGRYVAGFVNDIVPVLGSLLHQVPAARRRRALALIDEVAGQVPAALAAALRSLPRLCEEADESRTERWFERGLHLGAENVPAAVAYFALESRTSLRVLRAGSSAVTLEEVQGILRKYIHMLSGEPVGLRASDRFRLLLPLESFPQEKEVAIPAKVDFFETWEENFRLYRWIAAQLAGRREFGTYTFVAPGEACRPSAMGLHGYLTGPGQPKLLEPLFLLVEGFRVHKRLARAYRGLAKDGRWMARSLVKRWRDEETADAGRILDTILAVLIGEFGPQDWPSWLPHHVTAIVSLAVRPLAQGQSTVNDSVRIARELAALFESLTIAAVADEARRDRFPQDHPMRAVRLQIADGEQGEGVPTGEDSAFPEVPGHQTAGAEGSLDLLLRRSDDDPQGGAWPIGLEELRRLLEAGMKPEIAQARGKNLAPRGLYVNDLIGKIPLHEVRTLRLLGENTGKVQRRPSRGSCVDSTEGDVYYYDEWDCHIGDYRSRWCRVREVDVRGDSGEFFHRTLADCADLIPNLRREFQRMRPEAYRNQRGLEDGEDFDLNAAIEARVDLRARRAPCGKLYVSRHREERDVATLFLIDMSASTDERIEPSVGDANPAVRREARLPRRIVDITKEALVVMAAALEEIGDAFAIYGFSGQGRHNVEFYRVKSFSEPLNSVVKGRIGEIQPRRSTRMGAALRHAFEKMARMNARSKYLFLLSDGFPQDHDYGQDRRSNIYGIRDTAVALKELETRGIRPFCITVDKAGHDYLRQMCDQSRYMVINDVRALPHELPKIYQRVVRGWSV